MRTAVLLLAALAVAAPHAAQPSESAALAARIQARYATIRDFEGDFVQTYEGGVLRTRASERGTLAIKQPRLFRFVYTLPERKEFVSDGVNVYAYMVADRQVIVSPVPDPAESTTPALFLSGQANIARDFTASPIELPGAPPGLLAVKLVPRRPDQEYAWFALGVDPATLQIRHLVAHDKQGGQSAFTFSNLKENRGLADNTFRFRIPRGVDVVTHGARQP